LSTDSVLIAILKEAFPVTNWERWNLFKRMENLDLSVLSSVFLKDKNTNDFQRRLFY